jgi:hypothetical protein
MYRKVRGINWLKEVTTFYSNNVVYTYMQDGHEVSQSTVNMLEARKHVK